MSLREVGKVREDLLLAHAGREVGQHDLDGDAHAADGCLAAALAGLHGNNLLVPLLTCEDEKTYPSEGEKNKISPVRAIR